MSYINFLINPWHVTTIGVFLFTKGRDFLAVISYILCIIDLFISIVQYANLHYLDDNLMEQPTL